MRSVKLARVTVEPYDDGAFSVFDDGSSYAALPHWNDTHYYVIAHRCGYGDDLLRYCREHEVFHHVVGEEFFGGVSPVIWALAHGGDIDPARAALEEMAVAALQRFVRAAERPIIGGVEWDRIRARCLALLDA